jgi:hypothetical protein
MGKVSKIRYNQDSSEYNIGTTFDNIYLSDTNGFTLLEFFNKVKTFFSKSMFMQYGNSMPANSNVVVWYDTQEVQDE